MFRYYLIVFFIYLNSVLFQFAEASECYEVFSKQAYNNALVIGSGSFGSALSFVLSGKFENVVMTSRRNKNLNDTRLPKELTKNVKVVLLNRNYQDPILEQKNWNLVVFALPLSALNSTLQEHKTFFSSLVEKQIPFVSLSKGIESESLKFSDDIFLGIWPKLKDKLIVLSGPSFASEIVEKHPTFVTIAGKNKDQLIQVYDMLSTEDLKISLSKDVKGVLVGGAIKNVIAIALGIAEGLKVSSNTRAGLITLLFNEFARFSQAYGVKLETLYDFSGLGDIYLSSEGTDSRNKQLGLAVGQGKNFEDFLRNNTVEGYHTVFSLNQIIEKENMNLPLFQTLFQILYKKTEPYMLIQKLKEGKTILQ